MSRARAEILARLRATAIDVPPLPATPEPVATLSSEAFARFSSALELAGGRAERVAQRALAERLLAASRTYPAAQVASTLPECAGGLDLGSVSEASALADVELAIVRGTFGVAENGAVWVPDAELRHRALLFLTQHLILVIDASALVCDMHAAYARLEFDAGPAFGCFISGPSKTADIEQALVIGAHGARSTTVLVCDAA